MRYADLPFSPEVSSNTGFALIGVILLNIAINLLYFLWENGKMIWQRVRQIKCIREKISKNSE
jgi:hypothetical protein